MEFSKPDSSYNPIYMEKVKRKDFIKSIARKHFDKIGIAWDSKYAQTTINAMIELDNFNHHQER